MKHIRGRISKITPDFLEVYEQNMQSYLRIPVQSIRKIPSKIVHGEAVSLLVDTPASERMEKIEERRLTFADLMIEYSDTNAG